MYIGQSGILETIVYKIENILYILGGEVDVIGNSLSLDKQVALGTFHGQRMLFIAVTIVERSTCQIDVVCRRTHGFHFCRSSIFAQRFVAFHVPPYGKSIFPIRQRLGKSDKLSLIIVVYQRIFLLCHYLSFGIVYNVI